MKINVLQKYYIAMAMGICSVAVAWGADAPPPAKSAPAAEVPANPFGPKPATPVESPGQGGTPAMQPPATEYTGPESFVPVVREMLLQRFDKNKDGKLDAGELDEARALFAGPRGRGGRGGSGGGPLFGLRPLIMQNFGKPMNGTLNAGEVEKLRVFLFGAKKEEPKPAAGLDALRQDILKQFDKNGDGKLDEAETFAAKAFLLQMISDIDKKGGDAASPPKRTVPQPANAGNGQAGTTTMK